MPIKIRHLGLIHLYIPQELKYVIKITYTQPNNRMITHMIQYNSAKYSNFETKKEKRKRKRETTIKQKQEEF